MQRPITRGAAAGAGLIFHVFAQDSAATNGAGKASVAFGSWGCRYIRNGEAISGAITPEDITTIGTYAAPTANTNIRIKAVDNTSMIGVYEIHIHADWVNATNSCQSLTIYLTATGVAVLPIQIPLEAVNRQDTVRMGLTSLPNAAAEAAGGLFTRGTGAGQINQAANGQIDANAVAISGDAVAADNLETAADGGSYNLGGGGVVAASVTGAVGSVTGAVGSVTGAVGSVTGAVGSVTGNVGGNVTGSVGSVAAGGITAASIATNAIDADAIAADAVTEIQAGLATAAALATVQADTDDIQTRLPAALVGGRMDSSTGAMAAGVVTAAAIATDAIDADAIAASAVTEIQSGLATSAEVAAVQADTDNIQTRLPAALVSGRMDSSVGAMAANILTASALAADAVTEIQVGLSTLDAAGVRSAVGLASANLDTQLVTIDDFLDTEVAAIKAKTDLIPAAPAAVGDIPTANQNAAALLDLANGIETGVTLRQAQRVQLAASAGKLSGAATTTVSIRDTGDSKNRIVATVDASGNRSAVTLDTT